MEINELLKIESWKEYLNDYIIPLYNYSNIILKMSDKAKEFNKKTYAELDPFFKEALISGLKEDGKYAENALAKFYKEILGIMVEDPDQLLFDIKEGYEGTGARILFQYTPLENYRNVMYVFTRQFEKIPSFIAFSKLIFDVTSFIIAEMEQHGLKAEKHRDSIRLEKPVDLVTVITKFLEKALNTSINYNKFTFFAWTLRKITPKYMDKIYPNISKEIKNFLGITTIYKFKNETTYNILGYRDYFQRFYQDEYPYYNYKYGSKTKYPMIFVDGVVSLQFYNLANPNEKYIKGYGNPLTIGGAICRLNDIIFAYIQDEYVKLSKWFKNIPHVEKMYFDKVKRSLREVQWEENPLIEKYKLYILEDMLRESIVSINDLKLLELDYNDFISRYIIFKRESSPNILNHSIYLTRNYVPLKPAIRMINLINNLYPAIYLGLYDFAFNTKKDEILLVKRG